MPAIPTGQDDLDVNARTISIANPLDYQNVNPVTDGKRNMIPFGTILMSKSFLGTVLNGTIDQNADKKERPDGVGGVEAITYHKLRWEIDVTCIFKVMKISTAYTEATAGVGPLKIGDLITMSIPNQGQAFAAAVGTTQVATFTDKVFSVDAVGFKFSDGEYGQVTIKATHNVGLHPSALSYEVDDDGDALQIMSTPLTFSLSAAGARRPRAPPAATPTETPDAMLYISTDYRVESLKPLTVGSAGDPPATRWWGLRYNSGASVGSGVELSGSGYARVEMTTAGWWTATTFVTGDPAYVNAAELTFGTPAADWGYYNELALYDAELDTDPVMIFAVNDGAGNNAVYARDDVEQKFDAGDIVLYNVVIP